jgi:hypothetical protein
MSDFKWYRKKQLQEMRPYVDGEDMTGISVSAPDHQAGSPRVGDMIARNATNHADQWLVAKGFFDQNYEPAEKA